MTWVGKEQAILLLSTFGDWRLFAIWTCSSPVNNLFPFPLATALLIGDIMTNRWSGVKMFNSVITAPIVLAELIDFLIRRCYAPNVRIFILQIWSASPIQDINTSAPILLAFWWSRLIGQNSQPFETMPIYNALATGNRNKELYRETARSNWK